MQSRLDRLIQVYDVLDGWLATTCTLNATSATNIIQELFGISVNELDRQIAIAEPGSQGVAVLPYFNGERMPPLPYAKGSIKYLTMQNCKSENLIRATAESVIYTLKWGYDKLVRSFPPPDNLIITGGGGNSAPWRQIVANVFAMPVLVMESDEGGAFGAALQAMSIVVRGESLSGLCKRYIRFDKTKETLPEPVAAEKYKQFFSDYKQFVSAEYSIVM
jgi:xylulokinase